eukprot:3462469-Rhodomonas_salina.1
MQAAYIFNTSTGIRAPPGLQPGSTSWTRFQSPVPVPLWGDHGHGSPVSAGSPSPPGVYPVQTDQKHTAPHRLQYC